MQIFSYNLQRTESLPAPHYKKSNLRMTRNIFKVLNRTENSNMFSSKSLSRIVHQIPRTIIKIPSGRNCLRSEFFLNENEKLLKRINLGSLATDRLQFNIRDFYLLLKFGL